MKYFFILIIGTMLTSHIDATQWHGASDTFLTGCGCPKKDRDKDKNKPSAETSGFVFVHHGDQ